MEIKLTEVPSSKLKIIKNYGWVKENKLLEANKELKPVSDGLGLYICPYCDFKIVNCPNCGKNLLKKLKINVN